MSDRDGDNSLGSLLRDLTECPICRETLADPKTLPCLHTFCCSCLAAHSQGTNTATCPSCRQVAWHYIIPCVPSSGVARWEARGHPPRNWVHKKILGCAVELNTENCAWFGSQISLITAISFREAMPSPNHPPGALPLDPAGGPAIPLCPTSKSWLRHWSLQCFNAVGWAAGRASGL